MTGYYPSLIEEAAVLWESLSQNHPFVDGNKRIGHLALESFLVLNGFEIKSNVDVQEKLILSVASSQSPRGEFSHWLSEHLSLCKL